MCIKDVAQPVSTHDPLSCYSVKMIIIMGDVTKKGPSKQVDEPHYGTSLLAFLQQHNYSPALYICHSTAIPPFARTNPGKPPHEVTSYRPISLLSVMSKLFENVLLKILKPIIERKEMIPTHQFGFRNKHSTIDQEHRITGVIEKALKEK
jgi:hypothetical protein